MNNPRKAHFLSAKRVLRYIRGTLNHGILFPKQNQVQGDLLAYSDYDQCGDSLDRRSTRGYILKFLGVLIS